MITSDSIHFPLFNATLIDASLSKEISPQSRKRAIWMMGEFLPANPPVKATLIKIINNRKIDLEIQKEAIHALRGFKSAHTINFLGNLLGNKQDGRLRREAILTLATYNDKKALPNILSVLKDADMSVVDASINSLVQLAGKLPVIEKLKDNCGKNDFILRQRSIKTLSEICLHCASDVGNVSAKILRDFRTISDKVALKDIAIALKGYYPSDSAEVARRLYSVSTIEEQQELLELFDEIDD